MSAPLAGPGAAAEGRRLVLVVDDDADLRTLLELRLRDDYELAFADDVEGAVATAQRSRPDVVLLDIGIRGGDGFDVIERLLANGLRLPVIVLTARGDPRTEARAAACGTRAFFRKPFAFRELDAAIRATLGA